MTSNLVIGLKDALQDSHHHVGRQPSTLTKIQSLRPHRLGRRIEDSQIQHSPEDIIVNTDLILVKDLRGPNTPTPNLIIGRAIGKPVVDPAGVGLFEGPHLDLATEHPMGNLPSPINNQSDE